DYLGLVTLQHLAEGIGKLYEPEAKVTIINKEPYIEEMNALLAKELSIAEYCKIRDYQSALSKIISAFSCLSLGGDFTSDYMVALEKSKEMVIASNPSQLQFFKRDLDYQELRTNIDLRDKDKVRNQLRSEIVSKHFGCKVTADAEVKIQQMIDKQLTQKM